mmetsp:Transcript_14583/g.21384  ORF Transcript_14583/g.21384 Transcript_14583/m.21384 type:complete len:100 (+) Transcript_14583:1704-2003(+)
MKRNKKIQFFLQDSVRTLCDNHKKGALVRRLCTFRGKKHVDKKKISSKEKRVNASTPIIDVCLGHNEKDMNVSFLRQIIQQRKPTPQLIFNKKRRNNKM